MDTARYESRVANDLNFDLEDPPSYREVMNNTIDNARNMTYQMMEKYREQSAATRVLLLILAGFVGFLGLLMVIYHNQLMEKIVEYSDALYESNLTPIVLAMMLFVISFPPMIGFSLTSTVTGLVYGVTFKGWFIIAFGSIAGSCAAFIVFKRFLHNRAEQLIKSNDKLAALSSVLEENSSYWIISLIRICPFPYSLTNGALAGIVGVSLWNFFLASAITSPKLVLYLFIGSRIKELGKAETTGDKIFDLVSIVVTVLALTATAWILYIKIKQRLVEIQRQRNIEMPGTQQNDEQDEFMI